MSKGLPEQAWDNLVYFIKEGQCTPFLGAGASVDCIPTASDIAKKWAKQHQYPLNDPEDLARVTQYIAVKNGTSLLTKTELAKICRKAKNPDFSDSSQIHRVLADLDFPLYITTNYDDYMYQALARSDQARKKNPKRDLYPWFQYLADNHKPVLAESEHYTPNRDNPLVYHLHGYEMIPRSMVLTEDDYLNFLVWMTKERAKLPAPIITALADTVLLFIGYSHSNINFRVLFRAIIESVPSQATMPSVAVQLPPVGTNIQRKRIQDYLQKYYAAQHGLKVSVYWGTAQEFAVELTNRI